MENKSNKVKSTGINGYEFLLETYNSHKFPIIEDEINATFFPWDMLRDVDYIDPQKFYEGTDAVTNNDTRRSSSK